jgi:hypothetical protein
MANFKVGDKVKFGNNLKGEYVDTLTQDTLINGVLYEASAAHPKARIRKSSGGSVVEDPHKLTKLK